MTMTEQELSDRLEFALAAASAGGEAALAYFRQGRLNIETKGDGTPVTAADRACEQEIRARLASRYPADGVLGEEFGDTRGTTGCRWIIDPIDGTFSFIHGVPLFTTLIGLEALDGPYAGRAVAGVIHAPALGETVWARLGGGAWHRVAGGDPTPARVSATERLKAATVCTTSEDYWGEGDVDRWRAITAASKHTRGWPDAYGAMLVATGRCDAMVEPKLHPWDIAPFGPILAEAGGASTDWEGSPGCNAVTAVASNGRIHGELLALLR
jgi:histidinol phosphatase-like enzyme (inositol monophosphatase family)